MDLLADTHALAAARQLSSHRSTLGFSTRDTMLVVECCQLSVSGPGPAIISTPLSVSILAGVVNGDGWPAARCPPTGSGRHDCPYRGLVSESPIEPAPGSTLEDQLGFALYAASRAP
jgi:hypothetical protein